MGQDPEDATSMRTWSQMAPPRSSVCVVAMSSRRIVEVTPGRMARTRTSGGAVPPALAWPTIVLGGEHSFQGSRDARVQPCSVRTQEDPKHGDRRGTRPYDRGS